MLEIWKGGGSKLKGGLRRPSNFFEGKYIFPVGEGTHPTLDFNHS